MKRPNVSIFNLIEIFRSHSKRMLQTINPKTHCEHKALHDYYCDAEMPHITQKN